MEKVTAPKEFVVIALRLEDRQAVRREITVEELSKLPGSGQIKEVKGKEITKGKLSLTREDSEMREFSAILETKKSTFKIRIYQPRGSFAIAIGCPTYARDMLAALLSYCVFGDLQGFKALRFGREEFELIWKHTLKLGGRLREIHLRRILGDKVSIYHVTGKDILGVEKIGAPLELMKLARKIKRLGFSFPPNVLADSPFHFWVADWGGGTLYEPLDPLPHHILALARFFKEALEG